MTQIAQIESTELKRRLVAGEKLILLDVREDFERAINRVPTQGEDHHIPMGQIPLSFDLLKELAEIAVVVIYCHHGVRSMVVANWLAKRGVTNVENLHGGIDAYSAVDSTVPRY